MALMVEPHLSLHELTAHYKSSSRPVERSRWHALLLKSDGRSVRDIADILKRSPDWVYRTIRRYNADGPDSIRDKRKDNHRPRFLDETGHEQLKQAVSERPEDLRIWTGDKAARWIANHLNRDQVGERTGRRYLRRVGLSPQRPRPHHIDADKNGQEALKKVHMGYVYGFVHPASGVVFWLLLPAMTLPWMQVALDWFAASSQANVGRQLVLLWDGAPAHRSDTLDVPDGVHLVIQPRYSPEIQPAEWLWPLVRQAIANEAFKSIEELEERISQRCRQLDLKPQLIRRHTRFHWWPEDIPAT
jgi:transposase